MTRASTLSSTTTSSSQLNYSVSKPASQEPNPDFQQRRQSVRSASTSRENEAAPPRLPPRPSHINSPWDIQEEDDDEEPIYEKIDSNPAIYVDLIGAQPANTHRLPPPTTTTTTAANQPANQPSKENSRRSSTSSRGRLEIALHHASHPRPPPDETTHSTLSRVSAASDSKATVNLSAAPLPSISQLTYQKYTTPPSATKHADV